MYTQMFQPISTTNLCDKQFQQKRSSFIKLTEEGVECFKQTMIKNEKDAKDPAVATQSNTHEGPHATFHIHEE